MVEQKKFIHTLAPYELAALLGPFWGVSAPVYNPVYNPVDKSVYKPVDNLWTTSCSSVQLWTTCGYSGSVRYSVYGNVWQCDVY